MWVFKLELTENVDVHNLQQNGFSPVSVRMCFFKLEPPKKSDPQICQENGFSPVCVCLWFFKFKLVQNDDPQIAQENTFSPVCVHVKVTYLGIRSAHERVRLVEWKPIWLPRAYLMRGDLKPARGNLHVCKFLRDLTIIQIRTVTAEWANFCSVHLPNEHVTSQGRKEGRKART